MCLQFIIPPEGRVEGSYSVWQPDGRLMTVSYYIDGDSGSIA